MALLLDLVSWAALILGSAIVVIGAIGVVRLPDFFCRQHAAGTTDTLGAGLILFGLLLQLPLGLDTARVIFIGLFLLLTSPVASHALAQAAIATGMRPAGEDLRGKLPEAEEPAER